MSRRRAAGSPAWMTTFADMMSLLMCFFVLLLSFSEMDVVKYEQIAGNMRDAFGVQGETQALEAPSGQSLEQGALAPKSTEIAVIDAPPSPGSPDEDSKPGEDEGTVGEQSEELQKLEEALAEDIEAGRLQVQGNNSQVMIRIREKGAFGSGSADVVPDFQPVLDRIAAALQLTNGRIAVGGHTDDQPINTARFRSNWELSASRAVSVVHQMLGSNQIEAERVEVRAFGDSLPIVPNDTPFNRLQNRRVEIVVYRAEAETPWVPPESVEQGLGTAAPQPGG